MANDGNLNLKKLKRNKTVMEFLKDLEVFIFVDNFHQEAKKDAGYFIGLHSRLTNWDNLCDKLKNAIKNVPGGDSILWEVYRKTLWVPTHQGWKMGTKLFSVKGKVRQIDSLQRVLKQVCNKKQLLSEHVEFVKAPKREEDQHLCKIIIKHTEAEESQTAIPIIDMTIAAMEYSAGKDCSDLSIHEWISQMSGILAIEYTNSTPHSGRALAVVYELEVTQKQALLDDVICRAYKEKIPKEEKFWFRGRTTANTSSRSL